MREYVTNTAERAEMQELGPGNFIPGKGRSVWLTPPLVQATLAYGVGAGAGGTVGGQFLRKPCASKPANEQF